MRQRQVPLLLQVLAVVGMSGLRSALAAAVCTTTFGFDDTAIDMNPFRGFMTYQENNQNNFPTSLEYNYFPIKKLITGKDTYDFSSLDGAISEASANGNHFVFRVFIDYPSEPNSGLPGYLSGKVKGTPYDGGVSYDYDDPNLQDAMVGLIKTLGSKYDNDNRVGAVQLGLIGHWGEWHTVNLDSVGEDGKIKTYMPSRSTQVKILSAYQDAFPNTQLLVSADELDQWGASAVRTNLDSQVATTQFRVGWHDDNFCVETFSNDPAKQKRHDFETRLVNNGAADRWRAVPIGGEVQPKVQPKVFDSGFTGQNIKDAIVGTHASWLLFDYVFSSSSVTADQKTSALGVARAMGFVPYVSSVDVVKPDGGAGVYVIVSITNKGVAPPYYSLHLTVSIGGSSPVAFGDDLMKLMPGDQTKYTSPLLTGTGAITIGIAGDRLLPNRPMMFAVPGGTISIASADSGTCAMAIPSSAPAPGSGGAAPGGDTTGQTSTGASDGASVSTTVSASPVAPSTAAGGALNAPSTQTRAYSSISAKISSSTAASKRVFDATLFLFISSVVYLIIVG